MIFFPSKQGIPFRGKKEDITAGKNPGNFWGLLKDFAQNDQVLFYHLYNSRATYLSKTT